MKEKSFPRGFPSFLDGRDVRYLQGLATPLTEEATLDLFPPVAGGGFVQRFGALPPWLLERYLLEWGGKKLEEASMPFLGPGYVSRRKLPFMWVAFP